MHFNVVDLIFGSSHLISTGSTAATSASISPSSVSTSSVARAF